MVGRNSDITAESKSKDEGKSDDDSCAIKMFEKAKIVAEQHLLTLDTAGDLTDCENENNTDKDVKYKEVRWRWMWKFSSEKTDLSKYNGMTGTEFLEAVSEKFPHGDDFVSLVHSDAKYITEYRSAGGACEMTARIIEVDGKDDGTGCKVDATKDGVSILKSCSEIKIQKFSNFKILDGKPEYVAEDFENDFFRADYDELVGKDGRQNYSNGSMKFVLNNWKGEMLYKGDDQDPVWKASSGMVEKSGKFIYSTNSETDSE